MISIQNSEKPFKWAGPKITASLVFLAKKDSKTKSKIHAIERILRNDETQIVHETAVLHRIV